jgi:hypothetical protein
MNYETYEDLNKAKQKIMSLLQTKYGEDNSDYKEDTDTDADGKMNNIIKQLNDSTSSSFQMIPFIKKEILTMKVPMFDEDGDPVMKRRRGKAPPQQDEEDVLYPGNSYFRNANSFLSFNQQTLNLSNSLTNMNRIFKNLIKDIGYVEPQTIDLYNQSYDKFIGVFEQLNSIAVTDGALRVIMKDGQKSEFDRPNLINEFNNAIAEKFKLEEYNDMVKHTYNYKNVNVTKSKSKSYENTAFNNNNFDDDE